MVRIASNRVAGYALLLLGCLLVPYAGYLAIGPGGVGVTSFFNDGVYNAIMVGATATCLARGFFGQGERAAWLLVGIALAFSAAGDLYYTNAFSDPDDIPFPSIADGLYLAFFPPCYIALGLLVRSRVGSFKPSLWLDGVVAGLAVASVASALVFQAVLDATSGSPAAVATNLAYPLADFVMLAIVVGALTASGWRLDRTWAFVLAGLGLYAVADGIYLYQSSIGTYVEGRILDVTWPLAAVLLTFAAWQPAKRVVVSIEGWAEFVLPPAFAILSVGVLVFGQFRSVNALAVFLACAALAAVLVRLAFTFRENFAMLSETRRLNAVQRDYIEQVGHVVDAAASVEAESFEAATLDGVATREDALGNLARVFQRMARQVYEREQRLKAQVQQLKIEIDEAKAAREVEEITDTDYFRDLQKKASILRLDGD